jgi:hypothetical protein
MVKSKKKIIKNYSKLIGGLVRPLNTDRFTKKNRSIASNIYKKIEGNNSLSETLIPEQNNINNIDSVSNTKQNNINNIDSVSNTKQNNINNIDSVSNIEQKNKMDIHNNLSNLHYGKYINPFYNTADLKQKPLKFKTKSIETSTQDELNSINGEEQIIKSNLSNSEIMSRMCDFD